MPDRSNIQTSVAERLMAGAQMVETMEVSRGRMNFRASFSRVLGRR